MGLTHSTFICWKIHKCFFQILNETVSKFWWLEREFESPGHNLVLLTIEGYNPMRVGCVFAKICTVCMWQIQKVDLIVMLLFFHMSTSQCSIENYGSLTFSQVLCIKRCWILLPSTETSPLFSFPIVFKRLNIS